MKDLNLSTCGIRLKKRRMKAKVNYIEDVNNKEFQKELHTYYKERWEHPIKTFFKDLFGLSKPPPKRKEPDYQVVRSEYL